MVDNQHRKIKGYRDLTEEEIAAMNRVKEMAALVGDMIELMEKEQLLSKLSLDPRWLAIGRTDLQTGFMALTRAVAQPDFF